MALQLEHDGLSVVSGCEPVDRDGTIGGIYQPEFRDAGSFIGPQLGGSIVAGGRGREDFCDPVGSPAQATVIELLQVADDEEIGLYHGVDLIVATGADLRQADVKGRDVGAAGSTVERISHLVAKLNHNLLV